MSEQVKREMIEIPIGQLIPYENNVKIHTQEQIDQLKKSIEDYGFNVPIVIDEDNMILSGHGRSLALKQLGWQQVPCVRISHLTETQKRQFIIADNKISLNTSMDNDKLLLEINEILKIDDEFDFSGMGIEDKEIDVLLQSQDIDVGDFVSSQLKNMYDEEDEDEEDDFSEVDGNLRKHGDRDPMKPVICPHCGEEIRLDEL